MINAVAGVPGIEKDDITTLDLSVQPQSSYPNNGGAPKITGYTFLYRIQVGSWANLIERRAHAFSYGATGAAVRHCRDLPPCTHKRPWTAW